jgi:hypothetical protein
MWIFSRHGFFSVVVARDDQGKANPKRLNVRARSLDQLKALIARFPDLLVDCPSVCTTQSDYPHRIIVTKGLWRKVVDQLTAEIEYDNFKNEVARSGRSASYLNALHRIWGVGRETR